MKAGYIFWHRGERHITVEDSPEVGGCVHCAFRDDRLYCRSAPDCTHEGATVHYVSHPLPQGEPA